MIPHLDGSRQEAGQHPNQQNQPDASGIMMMRQSIRTSQTMPQLNYTREDIQEQYMAGNISGRAHQATSGLSSSASSSRLADKQRRHSDSTTDSPESDSNSPRSARRKRRRQDHGRANGSARRRSKSSSLFSSCFNMRTNLSSIMVPSNLPQRRAKILASLGLGSKTTQTTSATSGPSHRPLSSSQTVSDNLSGLAAAEPKLDRQSSQGAGLRKHVSFGHGRSQANFATSSQPNQASSQQQSAAANQGSSVIVRNYQAHPNSTALLTSGSCEQENARPTQDPNQGPGELQRPPIYLVSQVVGQRPVYPNNSHYHGRGQPMQMIIMHDNNQQGSDNANDRLSSQRLGSSSSQEPHYVNSQAQEPSAINHNKPQQASSFGRPQIASSIGHQAQIQAQQSAQLSIKGEQQTIANQPASHYHPQQASPYGNWPQSEQSDTGLHQGYRQAQSWQPQTGIAAFTDAPVAQSSAHKRQITVPMKSQATQTDITAYHLMVAASQASSQCSGSRRQSMGPAGKQTPAGESPIRRPEGQPRQPQRIAQPPEPSQQQQHPNRKLDIDHDDDDELEDVCGANLGAATLSRSSSSSSATSLVGHDSQFGLSVSLVSAEPRMGEPSIISRASNADTAVRGSDFASPKAKPKSLVRLTQKETRESEIANEQRDLKLMKNDARDKAHQLFDCAQMTPRGSLEGARKSSIPSQPGSSHSLRPKAGDLHIHDANQLRGDEQKLLDEHDDDHDEYHDHDHDDAYERGHDSDSDNDDDHHHQRYGRDLDEARRSSHAKLCRIESQPSLSEASSQTDASLAPNIHQIATTTDRDDATLTRPKPLGYHAQVDVTSSKSSLSTRSATPTNKSGAEQDATLAGSSSSSSSPTSSSSSRESPQSTSGKLKSAQQQQQPSNQFKPWTKSRSQSQSQAQPEVAPKEPQTTTTVKTLTHSTSSSKHKSYVESKSKSFGSKIRGDTSTSAEVSKQDQLRNEHDHEHDSQTAELIEASTSSFRSHEDEPTSLVAGHDESIVPSASRRDDFLNLAGVEREPEVGPLPDVAASRKLSSTSTLSARHHSYCSSDELGHSNHLQTNSMSLAEASQDSLAIGRTSAPLQPEVGPLMDFSIDSDHEDDHDQEQDLGVSTDSKQRRSSPKQPSEEPQTQRHIIKLDDNGKSTSASASASECRPDLAASRLSPSTAKCDLLMLDEPEPSLELDDGSSLEACNLRASNLQSRELEAKSNLKSSSSSSSSSSIALASPEPALLAKSLGPKASSGRQSSESDELSSTVGLEPANPQSTRVKLTFKAKPALKSPQASSCASSSSSSLSGPQKQPASSPDSSKDQIGRLASQVVESTMNECLSSQQQLQLQPEDDSQPEPLISRPAKPRVSFGGSPSLSSDTSTTTLSLEHSTGPSDGSQPCCHPKKEAHVIGGSASASERPQVPAKPSHLSARKSVDRPQVVDGRKTKAAAASVAVTATSMAAAALSYQRQEPTSSQRTTTTTTLDSEDPNVPANLRWQPPTTPTMASEKHKVATSSSAKAPETSQLPVSGPSEPQAISSGVNVPSEAFETRQGHRSSSSPSSASSSTSLILVGQQQQQQLSSSSSVSSKSARSGGSSSVSGSSDATRKGSPPTKSAEAQKASVESETPKSELGDDKDRDKSRDSRRSSLTGSCGQVDSQLPARSKTPPAIDCPYVHDLLVLDTSASSGTPIKPISVSQLVQKPKLSHDDTMEAIESDVEGEELELRAEIELHHEHASLSFAEQTQLDIEVARQQEQQQQQQECYEDDDDEESSISVSHQGVSITHEPSSLSQKRPPTVVAKEATTRQTVGSSMSLSSSSPSASAESAHSTPTGKPKLATEEAQVAQQAEMKVHQPKWPSKSMSNESATRAILDHLEQHGSRGSIGQRQPSDEPLVAPEVAEEGVKSGQTSLDDSASTNATYETGTMRRRHGADGSVSSSSAATTTVDSTITKIPLSKSPSMSPQAQVQKQVQKAQPDQFSHKTDSSVESGATPTQVRRRPPLALTKPVGGGEQVADESICSSCSCREPSLSREPTQTLEPELPPEAQLQPQRTSASAAAPQLQPQPKGVANPEPRGLTAPRPAGTGSWQSQDEGSVMTENYWLSHWLYISEFEEAELWNRSIPAAGGYQLEANTQDQRQFEHPSVSSMPSEMTEAESTNSERNFNLKYKSTTRKMIHRRASIEMYARLAENNLKVEKTVEISRSNGEFGFRIHGSRPVVVSAIERGTSAESCGLQVGDIIYAINGTNILDMAHSEVVRLAHNATSSSLHLELIATSSFLSSAKYNPNQTCRYSTALCGYLVRLSPSTAQPLLVELQQQLSQTPGASSHQRAARLTRTMRQAWRKRYFVLRHDNCLCWFKSPRDIEPEGAINLQGFSASLTNEFTEPQHVIRLIKYGGQPHYLGTNSSDDLQIWIDTINKAATEANQNDPYMKQSLQLARTGPSNINEPECLGYLYKYSHKRSGGAHWRPVYFVLKDTCLYLYRSDQIDVAPQASAVIYLHGYRVRSKFIEGKKYTFELVPPIRKTMRPMFLMASNDVEKKRWMAALEYTIERWIEID